MTHGLVAGLGVSAADEREHEKHERYLRRKLEQLGWECKRREDVCMPQALSALTCIFVARLLEELDAARAARVTPAPASAAHSATTTGGSLGAASGSSPCSTAASSSPAQSTSPAPAPCPPSALEQWGTLGFLVGWESLLSTYGKESGMLGDLHGALQLLAAEGIGFALCDADACAAKPPLAEGQASAATLHPTAASAAAPWPSGAPSPVSVPPPLPSWVHPALASSPPADDLGCVDDSEVDDPPSPRAVRAGGDGSGGAAAVEPGASVPRTAAAPPSSAATCVYKTRLRHGPAGLVLHLYLPRDLWLELPAALRYEGGGEDAGGARGTGEGVGVVRCVVALISLGINAQQSVANAVGATELQEIINCKALEVLRSYHDAYRALLLTSAPAANAQHASAPPTARAASRATSAVAVAAGADGSMRVASTGTAEEGPSAAPAVEPPEGQPPLRQASSSFVEPPEGQPPLRQAHEPWRTELMRLEQLMVGVEAAVLRSVAQVNKNTDVISLSERLVRALRGGRITSCKSGKDRTSMAVTAEQARLLHERHAVSEAEASELLDAMRSHGVRWLNMRKNVGQLGQYAFNWIQQRLLPEGYRAPKGTYAGIFGNTPT